MTRYVGSLNPGFMDWTRDRSVHGMALSLVSSKVARALSAGHTNQKPPRPLVAVCGRNLSLVSLAGTCSTATVVLGHVGCIGGVVVMVDSISSCKPGYVN